MTAQPTTTAPPPSTAATVPRIGLTVLVSAGFRNLRQYDWRETSHGDVDDFSQAYIPHLDKEHGRLISLNVEATK